MKIKGIPVCSHFHFPSIPHSPVTTNLFSVSVFSYSRHFIGIEFYNMWPFVSVFHEACLQVPSMLQHLSELYSFLWWSNCSLYGCIAIIYPSPVDTHLNCFQFWDIMKNAVVNIYTQVQCEDVFISLAYIPSSAITVQNGNFNFETAHLFDNGCTILHSHQQFIKVPISVHPCQHLLSSTSFIIAVCMDVKQYLIVVLICSYLMIDDIDHLFTCLLAICITSLEKCLFTYFTHF